MRLVVIAKKLAATSMTVDAYNRAQTVTHLEIE